MNSNFVFSVTLRTQARTLKSPPWHFSFFSFSTSSSSAASDSSTFTRHPESNHHPPFPLLHPGLCQHHLLPGLGLCFQPCHPKFLSTVVRIIILRCVSSMSLQTHWWLSISLRVKAKYLTKGYRSLHNLALLHPMTSFPITPLLNVQQPWWPPCWSSVVITTPLPQDLCTYSSCCLISYSSDSHMSFSWGHSWNVITQSKPFSSPSQHGYPVPLPCFIFLK